MSIAHLSAPADAWEEMLGRLQRSCEADAIVLSVHDLINRRASVLRAANVPAEFARAFAERGAVSVPWMEHAKAISASGGVLDAENLPGREAFKSSQFYREWITPQGFGAILIGVVFNLDGQLVCLLLLRKKRGGAFPAAVAANLAAAVPALALAWKLQRDVTGAAVEATRAWKVLDAMSAGILLIDERARVRRANRAAREMMARADAIGVRNGVLICRRTADAAKVRLALSHIITDEFSAGRVASRAVAISSPEDGGALQLILTPIVIEGASVRMVMVFLCDPATMPPPPADWLVALFGLSRVDADICRHMCRGLTPEEIATRMHSSVHTVRAHMKRIFARTGARRQAELVRVLMAGLSALSAETPDQSEVGNRAGTGGGRVVTAATTQRLAATTCAPE